MNYFIEGLQGSGKSTLVQRISDMKPDHRAVREGEYSPIELAWCARMEEAAYRAMLARYPDMRGAIEEKTHSEGDHKIVCYTKVRTENRAFYRDLEQYEIYNGRVSYEDFQSIILKRFAAWKQDGMIFECSLFQNIMEDMILFRCASDAQILAFYKRIQSALAGKDYHILYLKTADIAGNLNAIRKERSDASGNELWFPMMLEYLHASPCAKAKGLKGEDGLIAHFKHRQALELRICEELFSDRCTVLASKGYTDAELAAL
ncbi:MAG: hypothetical protein IJ157_09790 [Clostridia bacterium]|nr:hypothetical protein [Clostridia bacterium]